MLGARELFCFGGTIERLFGFHAVEYPPYSESTHYVEKTFSLLRAAGVGSVDDERDNLRPWLVSKPSVGARVLPEEVKRNGYIVVSPFSAWGTKMWFPERFAEATARIAIAHNLAVVLLGKSDVNRIEQMQAALQEADLSVVDLLDKTSVSEMIHIIQGARLLLANDSAPVHIAAAFDVPTVAVFGPTVKKWGFFPLSTKRELVEIQAPLPCRPCSLHGPQVCPESHFRCMRDISVAQVVAACDRLLADR
jgi:heptosyltransferase-2